MGVLRGLWAAAVLCALSAFCFAGLFAAGGAVAILVARARARDSARLAAIAAGAEVYWSLRGLGWLTRR